MNFYAAKFDRSYELCHCLDTLELLELQEECETEEEFTSILKAEEVLHDTNCYTQMSLL